MISKCQTRAQSDQQASIAQGVKVDYLAASTNDRGISRVEKDQGHVADYLDGIRVVSDHSRIEDSSVNAALENLIRDAKKFGCVDALRKAEHNTSYLLDESRASYLDIVGIETTDNVLEIGSSMGQHTRIAAKRCNKISALEVVPLQAAFAKVWCDEDGLTNVDVTAGGMSGKLPYDDSSFDVVICNYVLEWCAGRHEGSPEEFHRSFLAEINRCLRKGGRLFLSTKNRFSIRYLLGSEDEHLGVRFGSALPRVLQNIARRRANLDHPTGYLHSWNRLENILKDSGFSRVERILAFPDARYPKYIGSFSKFSKDSLPRDTLSKLGKKNSISLHLPHPLFKQTTNSIVFLAWK